MTEFYTVKQIDNSRLVRFVAPNHLRECARVVSLGALIALGAFLYAWQHFETIGKVNRSRPARGMARALRLFGPEFPAKIWIFAVPGPGS